MKRECVDMGFIAIISITRRDTIEDLISKWARKRKGYRTNRARRLASLQGDLQQLSMRAYSWKAPSKCNKKMYMKCGRHYSYTTRIWWCEAYSYDIGDCNTIGICIMLPCLIVHMKLKGILTWNFSMLEHVRIILPKCILKFFNGFTGCPSSYIG